MDMILLFPDMTERIKTIPSIFTTPEFIILAFGILLISSISFAQNTTYDLEVVITGLRNNNGQLMISLSKGDTGFPNENYYRQLFISDFTSPQFTKTIKNIPYGNYAVSLLHDEDSNGKMKRNLIRLPKEGFAFSRNYKVIYRAPKYDEVNFDMDTVKKPIIIKIQY